MGNRYDTILFDLDGTLTESKPGITNSVRYALETFGISEDNPDALDKFIGPPLKESFKEYYGFDDEMAVDAVAKYREYFLVKGMYENSVYCGIPEMLEALRAANRTIVLATSKPTVQAVKILKHFGLYEHFQFIAGSEMDGRRCKKNEVIAYALQNLPVCDMKRTVMVGDRMHDIIGAREVGIDSVGVLYGYGSMKEFESENATHIVSTVAELQEVLLL